jgi:hypothetical protein
MSDLPRIAPTPGASVAPVRPTRKPGREPRHKPGRDSKSDSTTEEDDRDAEEASISDDEPGKGGSINLRV